MNLPSTVNTLVTALETSIAHQSVTAGDTPFLRLLKSGEWVFGGDDLDVETDSKWAVNTSSFGMGFQAWTTGGELAGEEVEPVTNPPILRADLEDVGAEWKPMITVQLLCVSGQDSGLTVMYKTTSKGGVKALKKLMQEIVDHVRANPKSTAYIPVVNMTTDSYKHKQYGKIYTPILDIVDWLEDTPEAAKAATKVEPEPEPEPEKAAPAARTRRTRRA